MASPDLIWLVTRNNSSFLLRSGRYEFAREPGNLTGVNSFKASGLANAKTVDVSATEGGVVVSLRSKKGGSSPAASLRSVTIKKGARAANRQAEKLIKNYRPDLTPAVKAKVSALLAAQGRVAKEVKPKTKKPRGKKAASA
ncbi:ribosomal L28e/Mak16 [Hyaloraphidium curvatum]|nr:ribosomal L28e/Mak16 [Hyaloraphidium curvatum]